ncbi:MAG: glucosaminidase domain-containing protein [Sphingobacteriaceae bacterium]|nr:glucosaminidase domain-containing protein [Sphingobacteriaceae bacterium]
MKKIVFFLFFTPFIGACSLNKYAKNNRKIKKETFKKDSSLITYTAISYINTFKNIAIEEMKNNGIPASITLAQGLLESGNGNSDLAKIANNHFGVKCHNNWLGKTYFKDDDQINDCFRVYDNADESYKDHSEVLKKDRYKFLYDLPITDYKSWAKGLKTAGYATNPKYPELLIAVIEKYQLQNYDLPNGEYFTPTSALAPIKTETQKSISSIYVVKQGDTLYNISKRFNLTVEELQQLNNLVDNQIKLGQSLNVVK